MCGIFGLIDFGNGAEKWRHQVDTATDLLRHRGPDGRGVHLEGAAAFGHRRLAIIDPDGSPQPMLSPDGRFWLTYNGELYNYRQLREELISLGSRFHTQGDTEVVLEALIRWGKEALVRFNGMFALGFWDSDRKTLLIARDRLGVKPLFYSCSGQLMVFASEYPPLLSLDWIGTTPDPVGITAYLSHYQTTFESRTIYRDIRTLNGGEFALFDRQGFKQGRYWKLPIIPSAEKQALWPESLFAEASDKVRGLMAEAVKSHSIADVDVGVFLSGGIDSALITTLMCEQSTDRIKAYSIGFGGEGFNEFEFSSSITKDLGLTHKVVTFADGDYFPLMRELIKHKRAPLSTPNEIPIFSLARVASADLKVVLTGEGSDELFGGYTGIFRSPEDLAMAERIRRNPEEFDAAERDRIRQYLRGVYGKSGFRGEVDHWTTTYAWLARGDLLKVLGDGIELSHALEEIDACWQGKLDSLDGLTTFDRYLYLFETEHLRGLLTRLDACTMAGSLEGRVPFTDNDLVEFVWRLPFDYKVRRNLLRQQTGELTYDELEQSVTGKFILKEAFAGRIGERITSRRKQAFPVPLEKWLKGEGKTQILNELHQGSGNFSRVFSPDIKEWSENTIATGFGAMKVWMVWNLSNWLEGL